LVEIQAIAYAYEGSRSPRSVLRFHNLTWLHAFLCWQVIGYHTKNISCRKFYGVYFHKISAHAAIQNRLISGKSCHAEEQERVFNAVTNITQSTTSKRPGHIIGNVFLRIQAEKKMGAYHSDNSVTKQQAHISNLAKSLPPLGNTVVPFVTLASSSSSWQAHLERISDFLIVGKDIWWSSNEEGDLEFFDGKNTGVDVRSEGPKLHHFRSSDFKEEEAYLTKCWSMCLEAKIPLPLHVLRVKDHNKDVLIRTQTDFLKNADHINITSVEVLDEEAALSCELDQFASECTPDMPEEDHDVGPDASIQDIPDSDNTHYNLISPPDKDLEEPMDVDTLLGNTATTGA
jgi:hypothetical protein